MNKIEKIIKLTGLIGLISDAIEKPQAYVELMATVRKITDPDAQNRLFLNDIQGTILDITDFYHDTYDKEDNKAYQQYFNEVKRIQAVHMNIIKAWKRDDFKTLAEEGYKHEFALLYKYRRS